MAYLYKNRLGKPVTTHSYSAMMDFIDSPFKYYMKRVVGWREKENRGALLFGKCIEAAIQYFHENGSGGVGHFDELWLKHKEDKIEYTDKEGSWEDQARRGHEMLQLYEIKAPSIIEKPKFQLNYRKEVFPNTHLSGIEMTAYIDALTKEPSGNRIWDIKTSGTVFDDSPGIVENDLQLRVYSWITGVRPVGFVWFTKKGFGIKKGDIVTLLEDVGRLHAGEEIEIASGTKDGIIAVDKTIFRPQEITKQSLKFISGNVSDESASEVGEIIGHQIAEIVMYREKGFWPRRFGVRFPHDQRSDPYFRAFVLKDKEVIANLIDPNENWLEELEEE